MFHDVDISSSNSSAVKPSSAGIRAIHCRLPSSALSDKRIMSALDEARKDLDVRPTASHGGRNERAENS
jgi:hypothetical protein